VTRPVSVRIETGRISGEIVDGEVPVHVFRGVPYATPPVGELRWKPPAPKAPWAGLRACTRFGPACPQPERFFADPVVDESPGRMAEDCLYLNIWTPTPTPGQAHPVMVWLHGGGLSGGWSHQRDFDGTALARKGAVVVTVNYRLGPFGFFCHPALSSESPRGVSGNYGLLDQIAALRWVRANIAAFGGDPNRVTVFGESAGGYCVNLLRVSPLSRGLFQRAICQSAPGGARPGPALADAEAVGTRFAEALLGNDAAKAAALRAVPPNHLVRTAAPDVALADLMAGTGPPVFNFAPVCDEVVLCSAATTSDVPVLLGVNAEEGSYWASLADFETQLDAVAGYRAFVEWREGDRAPGILSLYPAQRASQVREAFVAYFGDTTFVQDTRAVARAMDRVASKAFLYCFTRGGRDDSIPGAHHAREIRYVFDNLHGRGEPADAALADTVSSFWIQFAATGDPNGPGLPAWPSYDATTERHLELGATIRTGADLRKGTCDALDCDALDSLTAA